jgi:hypothetical protein
MSADKKTLFKQLKEMYPAVSTIEVGYYGGGDSFDSFTSVDAKDSTGGIVKIDDNEVLELADSFIWHCLDNSNADFNDGGSEGTITLDLDNFVASIDNYELYTESRFTGTEHF